MENKDDVKINPLVNKSEQEKKDEYINVFSYFENANVRNRDAFSELLNYTIQNKEDPH